MHRSMWTYAWDILDLGFDAALGELRDRAGLNSVSLASSYHAGRFLQPRSPKRKVYFPEDGTIYFHPTPARWEGLAIQPKVAEVIEGGDVLRELVRRRDAGGLKVCCWTVCLHNTRLGMLHPGAVTRNAFGDPNYYNLCPSNPDARAYVCALVEDLTHSYEPDLVELESPSFMGFAHEFHHEKDGVGLNRGGRLRAVALLLRLLSRPRERRPASTAKPLAAWSRNGSSRLASGRLRNRASPIFRLAGIETFRAIPGGLRISSVAQRTGDQPHRRDQGARACLKPRRSDRSRRRIARRLRSQADRQDLRRRHSLRLWAWGGAGRSRDQSKVERRLDRKSFSARAFACSMARSEAPTA